MNIPRLIVTIIGAAVFFWAFDFILHGIILGSQYAATKEVWRPEEEMMAWYPFAFVCYLMISIGFCTVWAVGFAPHGHGVKCGAIYGLFLGLMGTGGMLMGFIYSPIPTQFLAPWFIGGILAGVLGGVVVALLYRPKRGAEG